MSKPETAADYTLDTCGYRCPMPVLQAEARLRRMKAGETLLIIADDPIAAIDIPHFCQSAGHEVTLLSDGEPAPTTPAKTGENDDIKPGRAQQTRFIITCGDILPSSV